MSSDCKPTREFFKLWHEKAINTTMHLANSNNYEVLSIRHCARPNGYDDVECKLCFASSHIPQPPHTVPNLILSH